MVGDLQSGSDGDVAKHFPPNFVGSTCQASIISATKGAIVVSLDVGQSNFRGVLLENTKDLKPSVVRLSRPVAVDKEEELKRRTFYLPEKDIAEESGEKIGATLLNRHTYLEPDVERSYQSVIPNRSIHKIHERKRLRIRRARPKFFLCSMCKTHCFDTDDDSEREKPASNQKLKPATTTPSIKISYKTADGQSVMDIVPQKSAKSTHKRKHRSKHKKSKKSRHDNAEFNVEEMTEAQPLDSHVSLTTTKFDSSSDTDNNKLVIDLKEEPTFTSSQSTRGTKLQSQKAKTKSKLEAKPTAPSKDDPSRMGVKNTRNVSTYEGSDGKIISVGDVIWGKIVGFPWWPGRVCAIAVNETEDGIVVDYVADIDWYCSPTKSHLSCSLIHPFLEEFEKRIDKKKKTISYKKAIAEAKYDAVLTAQYMQSAMEDREDGAALDPDPPLETPSSPQPEEKRSTPPHQSNWENGQCNKLNNPSATATTENGHDLPTGTYSGEDNSLSDNKPTSSWSQKVDGGRVQSPSVLIDAFLRSDQSADINSKISQEISKADLPTSEDSVNIQDCLTISLPSPESLLNTPP